MNKSDVKVARTEQDKDYFGNAVELVGLWIQIVLPIVFIFSLCLQMNFSYFYPVLFAAYGSGSLLTAAALIALSFVVKERTIGQNALILIFVIAMAASQGPFLGNSTRLTTTLPPNALAIGVTIGIFLIVAILRTYVLWKKSEARPPPDLGYGERA